MIKVVLNLMVAMPLIGTSQEAYWQQEVNYKIQVDVDVERHQFGWYRRSLRFCPITGIRAFFYKLTHF